MCNIIERMRTLNRNVLSSEHKAIIQDELEQGH